MAKESVRWGGYLPFQPGATGPWHELPRREARQVFKRVLAARAERVVALRCLLETNGQALDSSNEGIRDLERWFRGHVESDPDQPTRPRPMWLAVAFDIGLHLGELMIERRPALHWELFVGGKRAVSYHRPVIMGFADPVKHVDTVLRASSVAFRAVGEWDEEPDTFIHLLWEEKASENWSPKQSELPFADRPPTPAERDRSRAEAIRVLDELGWLDGPIEASRH